MRKLWRSVKLFVGRQQRGDVAVNHGVERLLRAGVKREQSENGRYKQAIAQYVFAPTGGISF